jgi:hypothetical protein
MANQGNRHPMPALESNLRLARALIALGTAVGLAGVVGLIVIWPTGAPTAVITAIALCFLIGPVVAWFGGHLRDAVIEGRRPRVPQSGFARNVAAVGLVSLGLGLAGLAIFAGRSERADFVIGLLILVAVCSALVAVVSQAATRERAELDALPAHRREGRLLRHSIDVVVIVIVIAAVAVGGPASTVVAIGGAVVLACWISWRVHDLRRRTAKDVDEDD